MSVLLFHGPGSKEKATEACLNVGHLIGSYGEDGLKKAVAQEVVAKLMETPPGDQVRSILVGPMDRSTGGASDALLKSIEEHDNERVHLFLWAWDWGEVSPTIRSRVIEKWCHGTLKEDESLSDLIDRLYGALMKQNTAQVIASVLEASRKEEELMRGLADRLVDGGLPVHLCPLWDSIRDVLSYKHVTSAMAVHALTNWYDS